MAGLAFTNSAFRHSKVRLAVLLHGWGSSSLAWRGVAPRLEAGLVVCPDLRGFGDSSSNGKSYDFDSHVRDVAAFIEGVAGDADVLLVGHSYGGLIAQDVAVRLPEKLLALVLLSTQSRAGPFILSDATRTLMATIRDKPSRDAALARIIPGHYRPGSLDRQEMHRLICDGCRADPATLRSSLLSATRAEPLDAETLHRASMPVLALGSEFDILPAGTAERVASAFPAGTAASVPGAGHCAAHDVPERLADTINAFLARVPARRSFG